MSWSGWRTDAPRVGLGGRSIARLLVPLALFAVGTACTRRDDAGVPLTRESALCDGIVGMEAVAWDYYNGVPVTDDVLPPPLPTGGVYGHTDFPLLGFVYPAGWTPFEQRGTGLIGVDLIRDDDTAVWRYLSVTVEGISASQARRIEIDNAVDYFGLGAEDVLCTRDETFAQGGGFSTTVANALLRAGDHTLLVATSVTPFPGLGTSSLYLRTMAAPTEEFPARALDTFVAIDWQFLLGGGDGGDRDGDGYPDEVDAFPDDPDRH